MKESLYPVNPSGTPAPPRSPGNNGLHFKGLTNSRTMVRLLSQEYELRRHQCQVANADRCEEISNEERLKLSEITWEMQQRDEQFASRLRELHSRLHIAESERQDQQAAELLRAIDLTMKERMEMRADINRKRRQQITHFARLRREQNQAYSLQLDELAEELRMERNRLHQEALRIARQTRAAVVAAATRASQNKQQNN